MAFNFPNSPTLGQEYEPIDGVIYKWDGVVWGLKIETSGGGGGGDGGIEEAPVDGHLYARKSAAWDDLTDDFANFAGIDSPEFTGTPTVPTPTLGDDSLQIVNSQWVKLQGYSQVQEAPIDGTIYGRKDADWSAVVSGSSDWADITGKPSTFPPTLPITEADVTNLPADLATASGTATWTGVSGKPTTFPPSTHSHPTSEVTGLDTALAGKAPTVHAHAESDITNLVSDLAAKAPLASPVFTGDPQAPTPALNDNDTSIATTAFVQTAVDTATGAGLFGYFDYTFNSTNYTPPPIAGNFRMNNATQTAVTHIYVHEQTAVGNDAAILLAQIAVGDKLLIQTKTDATKWQRYTVTAVADMGVYWDFTVTWVNGGGAMGSARTAIVIQKLASVGEAPNDGLPYVRKSLGWDDFTDDMTAAKARANHTGTQTASTISDFSTAADARVALKITNKVTVASSAPGSPATNDVWIDTT